jgi:hypothetical protein
MFIAAPRVFFRWDFPCGRQGGNGASDDVYCRVSRFFSAAWTVH